MVVELSHSHRWENVDIFLVGHRAVAERLGVRACWRGRDKYTGKSWREWTDHWCYYRGCLHPRDQQPTRCDGDSRKQGGGLACSLASLCRCGLRVYCLSAINSQNAWLIIPRAAKFEPPSLKLALPGLACLSAWVGPLVAPPWT